MPARCSNDNIRLDVHHRHVHFILGRAKAAQEYPRLFGIRLLQDIQAQRQLESLGLQDGPIMTVDQMAAATTQGQGDECPSGALHEVDCAGMTAIDDVSGPELNPKLMMAARPTRSRTSARCAFRRW